MLRKKHNSIFISVLFLALLFPVSSYADRSGTKRGFSGRSGISSRQTIASPRYRTTDPHRGINKKGLDPGRYYRPDYRSNIERRPYAPYADRVSPNAWRFNNQQVEAYRDNTKVRTYRPPAVMSDPRLSSRDYRSKSYLDYRYGKTYGSRTFDYSYRKYPLARYDHRYRKDSPFYRYPYAKPYHYGQSPFYYNRYVPFYPRLSGWPNYWYYPGYSSLGYSYGYYGSSYYGSSYYSGTYDSQTIEPQTSRVEKLHYPKRYIFVSLTGYWPGYSDYRYHDYGTYPYYWYLSAESPYQPWQQHPPIGTAYENDYQYDARYFASVPEPDKKTSADIYFEKGVTAFAAGMYQQAEVYFYQAKSSAPSDVILPFAYVQALFAQGEYEKAARQLRDIIQRQPVGKEWVYYPRGLYTDQKILMAQIENLVSRAQNNTDLQLLAGYQLLGIHNFEKAMEHLNNAQAGDKFNQIAVGKLLYVLNNLKTNYQVNESGSEFLN